MLAAAINASSPRQTTWVGIVAFKRSAAETGNKAGMDWVRAQKVDVGMRYIIDDIHFRQKTLGERSRENSNESRRSLNQQSHFPFICSTCLPRCRSWLRA